MNIFPKVKLYKNLIKLKNIYCTQYLPCENQIRSFKTTPQIKYYLSNSLSSWGTKRGDPSSKPHLREYARIKNKGMTILDEEGVLADEEYSHIICETGIYNSFGQHAKIAVIQPWIKWGPTKRSDTSKELLLEEACALIQTLPDSTVVYQETVSVTRPSRHKIFGGGQLDRLIEELQPHRPLTAVFISYEILTRSYKRELEEELKVRVLDRYSVVLAIFQQHANTLEAKLQVALAEIPYVKSYVHDDKQRLVINRREKKLKDALEDLQERRAKVRRERKKLSLPSVAIVGYTNAGKTSLIRALTGDDKVMGKNHLFATLDVTAHKCFLPCGLPVLLLDTVGFIQDIPTNLIASFMATLEDAVYADIVIHVRDTSHPDRVCQAATVVETLESLPLPQDTPVITVDSKIDVESREAFIDNHNDDIDALKISAMTGQGLEELIEQVEEEMLKILGKQPIHMKLKTGSAEISWLRKNVGITQEEIDPSNPQYTIITSVMNERDIALFKKIMSIRK